MDVERLREILKAHDTGLVTEDEVHHLILRGYLSKALAEVRQGKPYGLVSMGLVRNGAESKEDRAQVTVRPLELWFTPVGEDAPR